MESSQLAKLRRTGQAEWCLRDNTCRCAYDVAAKIIVPVIIDS
jgi:hypothetical protein